MRKKIIGCLLVLSLGVLISTGCAKKDVVRTDEPVAASQPTATVAPEVAPTPQAPSKAEPQAAKTEPMTETTPSPVITSEPGQPMAPAIDLQSALQKVYFNFDSSDLSEESRSALSKNAEYLSKEPSVKVRIEGNCDERGSDEYNMALGERRAKSAKDYLVNLGIASERLATISYGEEKPADPGHDEEAWAKNRRADFVIAK